jgi:hypothetical protein
MRDRQTIPSYPSDGPIGGLARRLRPGLAMRTWVGLAWVGLLAALPGCIPSFPPCDCSKADDDDGGPADFPDFDFLDRAAACADAALPVEGATCGYPEGPYGFEEGAVIENLELFDCMGNAVQLAQYLPQEGLPEVQTRGVVLGIGAAWCMPCAVEAKEWSEHFVDEYAPEIQFLQALDEGAVGAATMEICAGWSATNASDKFPILFTPDQASLQLKIEGGSGSPLPFTLMFDANANITFKKTGEVVDSGVLSIQLDALINDPYGN